MYIQLYMHIVLTRWRLLKVEPKIFLTETSSRINMGHSEFLKLDLFGMVQNRECEEEREGERGKGKGGRGNVFPSHTIFFWRNIKTSPASRQREPPITDFSNR